MTQEYGSTAVAPLGRVSVKGKGLEVRLWARIDKTDTCWIWQGAVAGKAPGYGRIRVDGRQVAVHRLVYELLIGPIPDGLQLDHLCRVTRCCKPAHLEPVTRQENIRRGLHGVLRGDHCPNGHKFTSETTYTNTAGSRVCIPCKRANWRKHYEANRERVHARNRELYAERRAKS